MELAPIVIFAYKRPKQLMRMLDSLAANDLAKDSRLIVFCDGPKPDATPQDLIGIKSVREIANSIKGFAQVQVVEATSNKGLARSVIDGVTRTVDEHGRTIVIEDDAVVSPKFLWFMNSALERFAEEDRVLSVGSWNHYAGAEVVQANFFIRYPDSLAWATWKRAWDHFEPDGKLLWERLREKNMLTQLDGGGGISYFSRMLKAQNDGKLDSWAIRWTASCILHEGLTLMPRQPLALNLGAGEGGTHEDVATTIFDHLRLDDHPLEVGSMIVKENVAALNARITFIKWHFEGGYDPSLKARIWRVAPPLVKEWWAKLKNKRPVQ